MRDYTYGYSESGGEYFYIPELDDEELREISERVRKEEHEKAIDRKAKDAAQNIPTTFSQYGAANTKAPARYLSSGEDREKTFERISREVERSTQKPAIIPPGSPMDRRQEIMSAMRGTIGTGSDWINPVEKSYGRGNPYIEQYKPYRKPFTMGSVGFEGPQYEHIDIWYNREKAIMDRLHERAVHQLPSQLPARPQWPRLTRGEEKAMEKKSPGSVGQAYGQVKAAKRQYSRLKKAAYQSLENAHEDNVTSLQRRAMQMGMQMQNDLIKARASGGGKASFDQVSKNYKEALGIAEQEPWVKAFRKGVGLYTTEKEREAIPETLWIDDSETTGIPDIYKDVVAAGILLINAIDSKTVSQDDVMSRSMAYDRAKERYFRWKKIHERSGNLPPTQMPSFEEVEQFMMGGY